MSLRVAITLALAGALGWAGVTGCGGRTLAPLSDDAGAGSSSGGTEVGSSSSGFGSSSSTTGGSGSSGGGISGSSTGSGSGFGSSSGSGSGSSSGFGSSSGSGSGSSSGTSSSSSSGGTSACTAATTVTGLPPYVNVDKQSACSMAQVSALVSACFGSSATATTCNTWFSSNGACSECVLPQADAGGVPNSGAILLDSAGYGYLNTPGCIQIVDGNTTCAAPLEALSLCEDDACNSMACLSADPTTYDNCVQAADNGACASQLMASNSGCAADNGADGGALSICTPTTAASVSTVVYEICGNGQ
jgi:hypothetical protein